MSGWPPRDVLLERAKYGEISGDEADFEAIRLGLGSLSRKPGMGEFRPETLAQWTLPMAVAWIAYLDLDEVREWSAPYRAECFDWRWERWRVGFDGPVFEGWHLEQRNSATLALLGISAAIHATKNEKQPVLSTKDAVEALWTALQEGFFEATGIDTGIGRRVPIRALEWHELVPVEAKGGTDEVRLGLLGPGYREVLLPSSSLRGYWRKREVPQFTLPAVQPPTGFGYMPLFCAAQWIASEGGAKEFDPSDVQIWRPAYESLLAAMASEAVRVVGVHGNQNQPVPAHFFVGLQVEYPYAEPSFDLMLSDELVLRSHAFIDDEHWRDGFDDALVDRGHDRWRRLSLEKGDVRKLWPFEASPGTRTGFPGRPALARHLIDAELLRRGASGEMAPIVSQEAEALLAWLRKTHPQVSPPTTGTIENNIRGEFRRLKVTK